MQKKINISDLDIPQDDIECWEKYPKHHWVYDMSRVLDAQNIKWSPFFVNELPDKELNLHLMSHKTVIRQPGYIYTHEPTGKHTISETYVVKGEIKHLRHIDPDSGKIADVLIGEIELRINAFVSLYFQKFTGIISFECHSNEIFRIRLRSHTDIHSETDVDVLKLIKRIYKRTNVMLSGPVDHDLHETLTT